MMYAPYAVVAGDSGVASRSSSDTPHLAQNALWWDTSWMTFRIVCVAEAMPGKVDDLAARRLVCVSVRGSGGRVLRRTYPYALA